MKITEEMKKRARQADIVALCYAMGEELFDEGNGNWRIKDKDGLIIKENYYCLHSSFDRKLEGQPPNTSNNTLSFAMYYYGMSFRKAVIFLNDDRFQRYSHSAPSISSAKSPDKDKANQIVAPAKDTDNNRIIRYLIQERGLDEKIVYEVINKGLLYQEAERNNCVFVCKDLAGTITGYEVKGILKTKFKRNYGSGLFTLKIGEPLDLWVFESAIDLLSIYEMDKKADVGQLDNVLLVSMGGLSKANKIKEIALQLKAKNKNSTVHIATDNDTAGIEFGDYFKEQNTDLNVSLHIPKKNCKDWNELLIFKKFH